MVLEKISLQVIKKELNTHSFLPREKRIFRIHVGNIPDDQVDAYVMSLRDWMLRPQPIMGWNHDTTEIPTVDYSDIPRNATLHPFPPLWEESPLERRARLKRERRLRHGTPRRLF